MAAAVKMAGKAWIGSIGMDCRTDRQHFSRAAVAAMERDVVRQASRPNRKNQDQDDRQQANSDRPPVPPCVRPPMPNSEVHCRPYRQFRPIDTSHGAERLEFGKNANPRRSPSFLAWIRTGDLAAQQAQRDLKNGRVPGRASMTQLIDAGTIA